MAMIVNVGNPNVGADLRVRPPRDVMGRVHATAMHVGTNRGPVIDGWRAGVGACPYTEKTRWMISGHG